MLSSQFSGPSSITAIVVVVAALTSAVAIPGLDDAGSKALVLWSLALVSIAVLWLTVLVDPGVVPAPTAPRRRTTSSSHRGSGSAGCSQRLLEEDNSCPTTADAAAGEADGGGYVVSCEDSMIAALNRGESVLPQRGFAVGVDLRGQWYKQVSEDSERFRYCSVCHIWRNATTSHCRECGRCIIGFDHHCNVLGVCIGAGNHRFFVLFLALVSSASVFNCVLTGMQLRHRTAASGWQSATVYALLLLIVLYAYLSMIFVFAAVHLVLFLVGCTTKSVLTGTGAAAGRFSSYSSSFRSQTQSETQTRRAGDPDDRTWPWTTIGRVRSLVYAWVDGLRARLCYTLRLSPIVAARWGWDRPVPTNVHDDCGDEGDMGV